MTLTLRYAARSDRGLIRDGNQDSVYAGPRLLAVADGMGGMAAGDVASNIVIGAMAPLDEDVPGDALVDALRSRRRHRQPAAPRRRRGQPAAGGHGHHADRACCSPAASSAWSTSATRGPTCCATASSPRSPRTTPTSRCSSTRAGSAPEEASSHPQRSLLTRALRRPGHRPGVLGAPGRARRPLPDLQRRPLRRGQRRDHRRRPCGSTPTRSQCVERLVAARAARRRSGQHHRDHRRRHRRRTSSRRRPIVGGAAARDRGMATSADESTPAARASALSAPRAARAGGAGGRPDDEPDRPKRHPVRTAPCSLVLLVDRSAAASAAAGRYTQRQYYVGRDRRRAASPSSRASRARSPASTCPPCTDAAAPDSTTSPWPRRTPSRQGIRAKSRAGRRASAGRADQRHPSNPNLKPLCPLDPTARWAARRRPADADRCTPTPNGSPSADASATPNGVVSASPTAGATDALGATGPTTTPDVTPSDSAPPALDPAGCRSPE